MACKNKSPPPSSATSSKPPTLRHVRKPVHAVEDSDFDEYVACVDMKEQVCAVENPDRKDKLLVVMLLNGHRVPFQLDTGATVNILPEESFKEVYGEGSLSLLDNADITLVMYNKTEEKPIGKKRVQVVNPRNGRKYSVEFVVAQGKGKPLLGLRASEQMQLISVVQQNIMAIQSEEPLQSKTPPIAESILKEHAEVFRREGKLEGDLHLEIYPNNNEFLWDDQVRGAALEETKKILSTTPVLKYFDPGATPTLQCDACMHGLGACLRQDGHPVAHASRSLTPTEVQYVQIEKELLAIVIAMEKFETYLYGRKVLVESDQKPLEGYNACFLDSTATSLKFLTKRDPPCLWLIP